MKFTLIGNVSTDITVAPAGNTTKASFGVKERKSRPTEGKENNFWNVTVFGKTAEMVGRYFKKGSPIFLTGNADWGEYTNQSGVAQKVLNLTVDSVSFVPRDYSEANTNTNNASAPATAAPVSPAPTQTAPAQAVPANAEQQKASDVLPF